MRKKSKGHAWRSESIQLVFLFDNNSYAGCGHFTVWSTSDASSDIYIYISLFISVTYIIQCPAKNGLQVTLNTKIHLRVLVTVRPDNTRCRVDAGSMLAQRLRRWPTTESAPTKHPCLTGKAAQFYIIIYTEVGPSDDHQLSVDDLINMFTYFNDYINFNYNNYNNYNNYKHYCHKCKISISKQHE